MMVQVKCSAIITSLLLTGNTEPGILRLPTALFAGFPFNSLGASSGIMRGVPDLRVPKETRLLVLGTKSVGHMILRPGVMYGVRTFGTLETIRVGTLAVKNLDDALAHFGDEQRLDFAEVVL